MSYALHHTAKPPPTFPRGGVPHSPPRFAGAVFFLGLLPTSTFTLSSGPVTRRHCSFLNYVLLWSVLGNLRSRAIARAPLANKKCLSPVNMLLKRPTVLFGDQCLDLTASFLGIGGVARLFPHDRAHLGVVASAREVPWQGTIAVFALRV